MATIERSAYGTHTDALTTGLNSLANGSTALSAAIDNSSDHFIYIDCELEVTFGTAPALNSPVELYVLPSQDGTNYADGSAGAPGTVPAPHCLRGVFLVRNVTSAQRVILERIEVPPGLYKLLVRNMAGQSMAASGNVLAYRGHELSSA
jgi:hypothetical protein